ncbi:hypothetical protein [Pseudonocardia lacus]|uniref:hypothetical protein n=1 Tax=Pseudonocardia lacus TaxID=2835865 RepID=UPI001BDD70C3|nr:hypothetical protein [Pseudonocardia lacus]
MAEGKPSDEGVPRDGGGEPTDSPPAEDRSTSAGPADASPRSAAEDGKEGTDEITPELITEIRNQRDEYRVTMHTVHAERMFLGPGPAERNVLARPVHDNETHAVLRHFLAPPKLEEARRCLLDQRLAVLVGNPRSGRRCAALALLHRDPPAGTDPAVPIHQLEFRSLSELIDHAYATGGRYVVTGVVPAADDDQQELRVDVLLDRLRAAGAYMVMTSSMEDRAFAEFSVSWQPVDHAAVLRAYIEENPLGRPDEDLTPLYEVAHRIDLHELVKLAERAWQVGVAMACDEFGQARLTRVLGWLDEEPELPALVPVVVATLMPGCERRAHERHSRQLHDHIDDHLGRDPSTADYEIGIRPSRSARPDCVRVESSGRLDVISLDADLTGDQMMAALGDRYGAELWAPVERWLSECPEQLASGIERQALATGLCTFAKNDWLAVMDLLDGWVAESVLGRLAAAWTLAAMCEDERAVEDAVGIAVRWARDSDQDRAVAATIAFGLRLGEVRPVQSVSRLWHLAVRDRLLSVYAGLYLGNLLRAAAGTPPRIRLVLSVTEFQIRYVRDAEVTSERVIGNALRALGTVLATEVSERQPLTALVLRDLPDQVERLGRLWAAVLQSWENRTAALEHLRELFARLDGEAEQHAYDRLGVAVRGALDADEWLWTQRDLAEAAFGPTATTRRAR